jgi:hypothetical protein
LNNAFMSLGRVAGPIWAGTALDINLSYPYLSGAVILLVGFVLSVIYLPTLKTTPPARTPTPSKVE